MKYLIYLNNFKKGVLVGLAFIFSINASGQEAVSSSCSSKYIDRLERKQNSLVSMKQGYEAFDVSVWEELAKKAGAKKEERHKIEGYKEKKIIPASEALSIKKDAIPISPRSVFAKK
ncbi:MAG: hypothetical protein PHQ52_06595 [Candidatus Omnitrophica bacterium]|nr:hypothetical protein [Candidatus Omnitrophota bacterium]